MYALGDIFEAQKSANSARNFMIASIAFGIVWIATVIVLRVLLWTNYNDSYSY